MASESQPYDIAIIGGGITGAGIARDAAMRGLKVALFDKDDFGAGTSSKSSKLVHGGLRYLEQGEIALVFESVSERRVQMLMAPHLVRPLPFVVPVFKDSRVGLEVMNIGLWIYDILALFRSPKLHNTMRGAKKVLKKEPLIRKEGLKGAIEYYDCFTDDSRLVLENIVAAEAEGAECHSYTEVVGITRSEGKVESIRVRDRITGQEREVACSCLIMATGPWSDKSTDSIDSGMKSPLLRPTKGVHVVFPRELLPLDHVITMMSPIDGRVMFAIPWRERIVIGTTDTFFDGDPDEVHAEAADVEYLCNSANYLFPQADFTPDKVISTWAGLRPLIHEEADSASEVSREHQIYVNDDGVLLIAGGKLTTYRIMAKDTVKAAIRWMRDFKNDPFADRKLRKAKTKSTPLPGGVGIEGDKGVKTLAVELGRQDGLSEELCTHWAYTYGAHSSELAKLALEDDSLLRPLQDDLPHTWAEIHYALRCEKVRRLDDILSRRVPLLLIGRNQGLDIVEELADCMAKELDWDAERREAEISEYKKTVSDSRRFRTA